MSKIAPPTPVVSVDDLYVGKPQFCKALRIHRNTFQDWEEAGHIHPVRIGRRVYVLRQEFEDIIHGRKVLARVIHNG